MRFKDFVRIAGVLLLILLHASSAFSYEMPLGDTGIPDNYDETMLDFSQLLPNFDNLIDQLPSAYDWRDRDVVTPAKDQGHCGGCWAFASVGAFEAKILMMDGKEYDLSEQQQLSCNSSAFGCRGGNMSSLKYWYSVGPTTETCTGYYASETSCANYALCGLLDYHTTGYYTVNTFNINEIKASLYNDGPAYFRFDVYSDFYNFWNTGSPGLVYTQTSGGIQGGHAVLIIGWDDARGAWLCKNSWGASAGPNGDGTFWIAYAGHNDDLRFGMANVTIKKPSILWKSESVFIPPYHIAADGHDDLGVRFVDVNNDGRLDMVYHRFINKDNQQKGAYLNTGNGWQWAPEHTPPYHIAADGHGDLGVRFVDVNNDGRLDMVYHRFINRDNQQKGAYLNTDDGWQWASEYTPPYHIAADGHGDLGVRFVDVNNDGRLDMLYHRYINRDNQQKGAYLNTDDGWQWAPGHTPPYHIAADGHGDLGVRFIDVNNDGLKDLIYYRFINKDNQQKGAYLNTDGGWRWAPKHTPPYQIAADGHGDLGVRFVDVNNDGRLDMVYHRYINSDNQQKGAYLNTDDGWQWAPEYTPPYYIAADGCDDLGVRFVDVNNDGRLDMVYHRYINSDNQQKGAYLNTGDSWQWAPEHTPPYHIAADGHSDLGARFLDVNNDGFKDLIYYRWINRDNQQKGAYINTFGLSQ